LSRREARLELVVVACEANARPIVVAADWRPQSGGDLWQDVHAGGTTYGYIYNAAKRLTTVTQNGLAAGDYAYDFAGHRVWRATYGTGAAQTAYVYDRDGHLLAEHNAATGAVTREYVWIDDIPVALLTIGGPSQVTTFIHTGRIDEPQAVTTAPSLTRVLSVRLCALVISILSSH
jgi:YD repeat-containing protein